MSEPGSLQHVIDWLRTQPENGVFNGAATPECLYCQYGSATGLGDNYDEVTPKLSFKDYDLLTVSPRTFGNALSLAISM